MKNVILIFTLLLTGVFFSCEKSELPTPNEIVIIDNDTTIVIDNTEVEKEEFRLGVWNIVGIAEYDLVEQRYISQNTSIQNQTFEIQKNQIYYRINNELAQAYNLHTEEWGDDYSYFYVLNIEWMSQETLFYINKITYVSWDSNIKQLKIFYESSNIRKEYWISQKN